MNSVFDTFIYLMVGIVGGLIGWRLKISGGVIIGAMLAVILFRLLSHKTIELSGSFNFITQILIGVIIGCTFKPEVIFELKGLFWPVALSTLVLVVTGLITAIIIARLKDLDISTAYLATSPGAMTALVGFALDSKANPTLVVTFHFFRLSFINLTYPFIFALISWLLKN
jgi:membrane AbrB-like protein